MSRVLHRCMTKALVGEGDDVRIGPHWVGARRGLLKVCDDALLLGDWRIPYERIEDAAIAPMWGLFTPGYILRVKADGRTYQFGLNRGRYWKGDLPFPASWRSLRLRGRWRLWLVRTVLLAGLAYLLWSALR